MGKHKATLSGQLADIDLKLLRIFKAIADNGGITASEDDLNIATSTISNYLADLESRLDMRLCQRGRKGFSLTEQGKTVYSAIQELLLAIEQFQGRIRGSKERLIGNLHLGIAEGVSSYPSSEIQNRLQTFTNEAPEAYMDLHILIAEEVPQAVLDERITIGISYLAKTVPGLNTIALQQENLLLYCGKQHPLYPINDAHLKLDDIEKHKIVETPRLKRAQELRAQTEHGFYQAYAPSMEARVLLLKTGNFLAYLPEEYVDIMGLKQQLRPLLSKQLNYRNQHFLMTRKDAILSPVAV